MGHGGLRWTGFSGPPGFRKVATPEIVTAQYLQLIQKHLPEDKPLEARRQH